MASPSSITLTLLLLSLHVDAKFVIPEDGYTVTTVLDGHKFNIHPRSALHRPASSDLVVLDSAGSVFYTMQFPLTQESVLTRFSGNGTAGYSDGAAGSAQFNRPGSFAVDLRGNVYVADINNGVIRKISAAGVTTIAGGFSEQSSRKDGPAQSASFSPNFELTFAPGQCALLVTDRGYGLVRLINLKEEDCTFRSKSGLGAVMIWTLTLGLILSCLLGLVIGIAIRPYIIPHEVSSPCRFTETWKSCLTSLVKLAPILYFGIKNAVASFSCSFAYKTLIKLCSLCRSHVLLMFRVNIFSPRPHLESVSLLDLDACNSGEVTKSSKYHDQLKDLINFDEEFSDSTGAIFNQGYGTRGMSDVIPEYHGADVMMVEPNKDKILQQISSMCDLGVVKRR
ncbi:hypothetical protein RIF29_33044 [Crotalaria pallida]|uniref:NHL repeat-containing protein n=1 Tax=Crotalaria pallida TaxID=3830 RepID=A0AAN9E7B7_CROPI